jgi:hypothetical protein
VTAEKPSPGQIRSAFVWLANQESGQQYEGGADLSESVRRVLGPRAYEVVAGAAQQFQRRWSGR